jgi:ADP-heptose:LPS heptosyltransferase
MSRLSFSCVRPTAIFANGFGDHLLSLPAIRALSQTFLGNLTLVCNVGMHRLYFSDVPLSKVIEVPFVSEDGSRHFDVDSVQKRIRECDLLLSLNPWHSRSVDELLEALHPTYSIGFFPAFSEKVDLDFSLHSSELAFQVPLRICRELDLLHFSQPPALDRSSVKTAKTIRNTAGNHILLAVHADTPGPKQWPPSYFNDVFDALSDYKPKIYVLLLGERNPGINTLLHHVIPCYGISMVTSMALIAVADAFVGIDSCLLHAADLFRVPGVGIFGPTNPMEFGFRFSRHVHLRSAEDISGVSPKMVLEGIDLLMESLQSRF